MNDVYIFIGRSGAGKGTQSTLLQEKLKAVNPAIKILIVETGKKFRDLLNTHSRTSELVHEMMNVGTLPPPFLGVHMWSHTLIEEYSAEHTVFIDGTPRVPAEVPLLLSAAEFYGWNPHVFNLQVSDDWAYEHIKARGRDDDKDEKSIWGRIRWYHEFVDPSIDLLRESPLIQFHDIHGEQTIETIHAEICYILGL